MPIRREFFEDFAAAEKPGTLGSQAICATPWDSNPSRENEIKVLRRPVESTAKSGPTRLCLGVWVSVDAERLDDDVHAHRNVDRDKRGRRRPENRNKSDSNSQNDSSPHVPRY